MLNKTEKKEYDSALAAKALTGLCMRAVIALYIIYLAWRVLSGLLAGETPIPPWAAIVISLLFAGASIVFCVYSWKVYKKARKEAELRETQDNLE